VIEIRCRDGTEAFRALWHKKLENQRLLNDTQEKELVRYINSLYKRGLPPLRQMIRNFISKIGGREAGKS
jgi:hypothetical protein